MLPKYSIGCVDNKQLFCKLLVIKWSGYNLFWYIILGISLIPIFLLIRHIIRKRNW